jgi:OmpA-OmpF porin, OOP family
MKKILLLLTACSVVFAANSQVLKRLGDRAKQKLEQKAGEKVDKGIDDTVDGATKKKSGDGDVAENTSANESKGQNTSSANSGTLKSYSRYDFVPGDKILYTEDFAQEVIGEFPAKWNTNGGGEIVTLDGVSGKWLKLEAATVYDASFKGNLPENYTIEFDLLADYDATRSVPWVNVRYKADPLPGHAYGGKIELMLAINGATSANPDGVIFESFSKDGDRLMQSNKKEFKVFSVFNHTKKPVHVSMWIQKDRFRAWLNEEKVYDFPKGAPGDAALKTLQFDVGNGAETFKYFLSNLKIAAATADNRSKLITEGKWSTTGILFDVNSDKIKPTSYGTLKQIADVLTQNADVKVKIIGHTDSDGADNANLELSKKRAAAVKQALSTEFGVDGGRIQTDGMGESKPVADNNTAEGKAQNRRVEFVKM